MVYAGYQFTEFLHRRFKALMDDLYHIEKLGQRETTHYKERLAIFNQARPYIQKLIKNHKISITDGFDLHKILKTFRPYSKNISYNEYTASYWPSKRDLSRTSS